jgi:hypothetical protein
VVGDELQKAVDERSLPPWIWFIWIPQLLTSLTRPETHRVKPILKQLAEVSGQTLVKPWSHQSSAFVRYWSKIVSQWSQFWSHVGQTCKQRLPKGRSSNEIDTYTADINLRKQAVCISLLVLWSVLVQASQKCALVLPPCWLEEELCSCKRLRQEFSTHRPL